MGVQAMSRPYIDPGRDKAIYQTGLVDGAALGGCVVGLLWVLVEVLAVLSPF